jgi:hypothetical protein
MPRFGRLGVRLSPLVLALGLLLAACNAVDPECVACLAPEPDRRATLTGELGFRVCISSAPQAAVEASRCDDVSLGYIAID